MPGAELYCSCARWISRLQEGCRTWAASFPWGLREKGGLSARIQPRCHQDPVGFKPKRRQRPRDRSRSRFLLLLDGKALRMLAPVTFPLGLSPSRWGDDDLGLGEFGDAPLVVASTASPEVRCGNAVWRSSASWPRRSLPKCFGEVLATGAGGREGGEEADLAREKVGGVWKIHPPALPGTAPGAQMALLPPAPLQPFPSLRSCRRLGWRQERARPAGSQAVPPSASSSSSSSLPLGRQSVLHNAQHQQPYSHSFSPSCWNICGFI